MLRYSLCRGTAHPSVQGARTVLLTVALCVPWTTRRDRISHFPPLSPSPPTQERYASRINKILQGEPDFHPLNPSGNDLFRVVSDGKWLCR